MKPSIHPSIFCHLSHSVVGEGLQLILAASALEKGFSLQLTAGHL